MVKLDLILSCRSSLRWPLPESRKQGFGIIWGSSSSKRCFSFHWIWWCRACLRHPKHINMVYLYPQRDFSVTVNKLKKKKKKKKIQVPGTSSVSPNSLSSFPLLAGFVFSCFCISLRFNSRLQHVTTRSLLFLKISSFVGCKTPWRGCCLPCSPDNVVTSRNLSGYWTAVWGSGPERPCVVGHLESFPPGNS